VDRLNSNVDFYVDGTKVSSNIELDMGDIPMTESNFIIANNGGDEYFDGKLDDVMMHYGILSDTHIGSLANIDVNPYNDPKLIAGYRFDALGGTTVFDDSPNKNNGTLVNMDDSFRLSPSYINNNVCLQLDSNSNQYMEAPMNPDSEFNQMTLAAWVKPSQINQTHTLVHKEGCFTWAIDNLGKQTMMLENVSTQPSVNIDSTSQVTINEWNHIAVTVDQFNSKVTFFRTEYPTGGTANYTSNIHSSVIDIPMNSSNLFIGCKSNAADIAATECFDGSLDDVLIYDAVLSGEKIGKLGNNNFQSDYYQPATNIAADTWAHIATTYDESTGDIKVYHDAVNVASYSNYTLSVGSNDNPIYIGKSDEKTYFKGKIDDVRIYDKVLSGLELVGLSNSVN
jgi:hypothetical protein